MDRNESVPEKHRLGGWIGSKRGHLKAAFETCGGRAVILDLPVLSLLQCANVALLPTFSHP